MYGSIVKILMLSFVNDQDCYKCHSYSSWNDHKTCFMLSSYSNFLPSLMMVDCMSSYCLWVIPPLSYNSCSCISCCTHCPRKFTRLLGEIAVLLLSLPPDLLTDDLGIWDVFQNGLFGGSSYELCFLICMRCAQARSCSSVYYGPLACFFLNSSSTASTSVILSRWLWWPDDLARLLLSLSALGECARFLLSEHIAPQ